MTAAPCICPGGPYTDLYPGHRCECPTLDAHTWGPSKIVRLGDEPGAWATAKCTTCGASSFRPIGDGDGLDKQTRLDRFVGRLEAAAGPPPPR